MTNTGNLTSAMCLEYLAGKSCAEVGRLFGISGGCVGKRFKKIGFPLRPKSTPIRTAPFLGEMRGARSLGKHNRSGRYIYIACPECNQARWVRLDTYKENVAQLCFACTRIKVTQGNIGIKRSEETKRLLSLKKRGAKNPRWMGGIRRPRPKSVPLPNSNKYSIMARSNGHVFEHRLIVAEKLGRPLSKKEVVHHRNRDRRDNRIENLLLLRSQSEHVALHSREDYKNEMP